MLFVYIASHIGHYVDASKCFGVRGKRDGDPPVTKAITLLRKECAMSSSKQSTNTPAADGKTTYGQHTGNLGFVVTDNGQTKQPDGSTVTREYRAIGEGPVINDTSKKK